MSSVRFSPVFLAALLTVPGFFCAAGADSPSRAGAASKDKSAPVESEGDAVERHQDRRINFPNFPDAGRLFRNSESFITPTTPEVVRPRSQAEQDQRNNWVFLTPDDTMRSIMNDGANDLPVIGPDGRDLNSYTALERFMHRQSNPSPLPSSTFLDAPAMSPIPGLNNPGGLSPIDGSFLPNSGFSSDLPGMHVLTPIAPSLANPFGLPGTGTRNDLNRQHDIHQQHLDAYKRLLNPPALAPQIVEQPNPLAGAVQTINSPFALPEGTLNSAATLNGMAPATPAGLDAIDASRSRERNSSPPRPDFSIPQRAF